MSNQNSKCPNCGEPLETGLNFCPHCGAARPQNNGSQGSSASRFGYFMLQFLLALGILIFGGIGACSAYFLATHQTASEMGDLSGFFWTTGLSGLSCCAACLYFARRTWKN